MNRGWYTERDQTTTVGEGSERARELALLLAEVGDADFIQSMIHAKSALDAFGGKVFIGAKRLKFNARGQAIPQEQWDSTPGIFRSVAYVVEYDAAPVRGEPEEPPTTFNDAEQAFEQRVHEAATAQPIEEPVPA